jgi:hypothetical protein
MARHGSWTANHGSQRAQNASQTASMKLNGHAHTAHHGTDHLKGWLAAATKEEIARKAQQLPAIPSDYRQLPRKIPLQLPRRLARRLLVITGDGIWEPENLGWEWDGPESEPDCQAWELDRPAWAKTAQLGSAGQPGKYNIKDR